MQTTGESSDRAEIGTRLITLLEKRFGEAARTLTPDADLSRALPGFDSLSALEYVTAVEGEFDFEVDFVGDDVRYQFGTLGRTAEYVRERIEDRSA